MSHCHRELTHQQWKLLLDDEFLDAYEHGIVSESGDGIMCRFYPRIFTYSCDYKEKCVFKLFHINPVDLFAHGLIPCRILMTTIRNNGDCPCPRCKIVMENLHLFGTESDRNNRVALKRCDDHDYKEAISSTRHKIYNENYKVTAAWVERKLKPTSLVPTTVNHWSMIMGC
jgi:hypothetical protein